MTGATRPWCAACAYPGLQEFIVGTVHMPADAKQHEVESAILKLATRHIRPGFTIRRLMPGALVFHGEDDA